MFGKKKGFSASQSRHTSRKMISHTIGTHVARGGTPRHSRGMNASSVGFSNDRKKRRAARGIVDHVTPQTASGENGRAYSRRVNKRGYIQDVQRKSGMRRAAVGVVSVLIVIAVAIGVGMTVFSATSNSKLSLQNSNASSALVSAKDGSPYYVLAAANLGSPKRTASASDEAYILARVDASSRTLTLVAIPGNLAVGLSDGKTHPLYDAYGIGGDEALVRAVSSSSEALGSFPASTLSITVFHWEEDAWKSFTPSCSLSLPGTLAAYTVASPKGRNAFAKSVT